MLKKELIFNFVLCLFFALIALGNRAEAVTISVSPMRGGTTLRFDRTDVRFQTDLEVKIRVTSTDSTQYQIYQRWIQPPTAAGMQAQQDFLKFYAVSGSNGSGTLYGHFPEYIPYSDQLVYSSSQDGLSDNFILVYQVDKDRLDFPGEFIGRLMFTVRPLGAGAVKEAYLDVFVSADLELSFSVRSSYGGSRILLKPDKDLLRSDAVEFSHEGNLGELRVYQEVLSPISLTEDQDDLVNGVIEFSTAGSSENIRVLSPQNLDKKRTLLYSSHENKDQWSVLYRFNPDEMTAVNAGNYHGKIRYELQASGMVKYYDMDIDVEIDPVFEINLDFPRGQLKFDGLYPGAAPQESLVRVTVKSNLSRPYMISQNVLGPLVNENRKVIKNENFMMMTQINDGVKGRSKMEENFVPVETASEQVVYSSDDQGKPASFDVKYRVVPYDELSPGDYQTQITYTLSEI